MQSIRDIVNKPSREITVVQFGEGNFLRAFVDWMIDIANEKQVTEEGVAIVKPISFGSLDALRDQGCVYTVLLRGRRGGETVEETRLITSVQRAVDCYGEFGAFLGLARQESLRFVVSNTTEAGIVYDESDRFDLAPPNTYPGKLTRFLYERYEAFSGAKDKGLILLPCELIEANGERLRECVLRLIALWKLPGAFHAWVEESCLFCSTLVDRIVTGYPSADADRLCEQWGYEDKLLVTGESFALWVIESADPAAVQKALPLDKAGLPVVFTDNLKPYRDRKVRLLNGAHTGAVLAAYLAGFDTVGDCMADPVVRGFMVKMMYDEAGPTIMSLPRDEIRAFADSVVERFSNPFIRHEILSIALNSVSKWKSRILPSLRESRSLNGRLPELLTFSFAALIQFYRTSERGGDGLTGRRAGRPYQILDDKAVLDFFAQSAGLPDAEYAAACAARADFWGEDLSALEGFTAKVAHWLGRFAAAGVKEAMKEAAEL